MLILALDTSGDTCSAAVTDDHLLRAAFHFAHRRRLTERLPGIIDFVLREADTALSEVDAFAVGRGPGSFTGVRVGVTMAKVWAEVLGKPLAGVSSLDALRAALPDAAAAVALAPSRRGEVIAAFYPAGGGASIGPELVPTEDVLARARLLLGEGSPLVLTGEAAAFLPEPAGAERRADFPRAEQVAVLARARLLAGDSDDPATLAPLYIAPTPVG